MKLNRGIMWLTLLAILDLIVFAIVGAFYGADKAKVFFNSAPLSVFWYVLALLLLAGLVEFPSLLRRPGLLMLHTGCLLIIGGSMWGSDAGHRLAYRFLKVNKLPGGYMVIYKGQSENNIFSQKYDKIGQLPFSIKLNDFRIQYYEPNKKQTSRLPIQTAACPYLRMPRAYYSDVSIIKDGKQGLTKTIRVNHPLHYGGYHFYQFSYDADAGQYTILSLTSDSGLYIVYTGYWLLCLGVIWQFWFRHIVKYIKKKIRTEHKTHGY